MQNSTQIRKNQKLIKKNNDELIVKVYPKIKRQPIIQQQPKIKSPNCPCCKFDKSYYCEKCEYIINKQKHQIDKKNLRQDQYFSTRSTYANKKITQKSYSMANTTFNSTEDMIKKLQSLKC